MNTEEEGERAKYKTTSHAILSLRATRNLWLCPHLAQSPGRGHWMRTLGNLRLELFLKRCIFDHIGSLSFLDSYFYVSLCCFYNEHTEPIFITFILIHSFVPFSQPLCLPNQPLLSPSVGLAGLNLTMWPKLALSSWKSSCLHLLGAGIAGTHPANPTFYGVFTVVVLQCQELRPGPGTQARYSAVAQSCISSSFLLLILFVCGSSRVLVHQFIAL